MSTSKPIIAVDIDDVLAANAEGFVAYSNHKWGTNLTVEDYHEHWGVLWGVDIQEVARRSEQFHGDRIFRTYKHNEAAKPVLQKLAKDYELVIVTSRRDQGQQDTVEWIDKYFHGIFSEIHFAGMWDTVTEHSVHATKADLSKQVGVDYLIDDQIKHCLAVAEQGMTAILFGDYTWNQLDVLPERVTRCADWEAVGEYFNSRSL